MKFTRRSSPECIGAFLLFAIVIAANSQKHAKAQAFTYDTIAITGEVAPGTTATFSSFFIPVINDAGQIAFLAELAGNGVTGSNDHGIFSETQGILSRVAREGDAAPGAGPGVNFGTLFNTSNVPTTPAINVVGQKAFLSRLTGSGVSTSNDGVIYSEFGGALRFVAREGDAAPGTTAGVNFRELFDPDLNSSGQIAFLAHLTGPGIGSTANQGIFLDAGGNVALMARDGQNAPSAGRNVFFRSFGLPELNDSGQTAFVASLTGSGVNSSNNLALYLESGGTFDLIARSGNAVPGAGPGVNFDFLNTPVLNDAGQLAFRSILSGTGTTGSSNEAIFVKSSGILGLVAREGEAAPGTGPGVLIGRIQSTSVSLNNAGQIVFRSTLTGTGVTGSNDGAIFSTLGGTLSLVARMGDAAPGTGPDVQFSGFDVPMLNDSGHVAFHGFLTGPDVNATNNQAIFATTQSGTVQLIARHGDLFDVDPDPFVAENRTIRFAQIVNSSGSFNRPNSLNNASQIVFRLGFTDLTEGIFVANIAIPEPTSLALLALGGLALSGRRYR